MRVLLPVLALAALGSAAATLAATGGGREDDRVPVRAAAAPASGALDRASLARVCVARQALCPVGAGRRVGDPCGCPHPLRGSVPGHVERVGGTSERPLASRWPDADGPDPLDEWEDALLGP